MDDKINRVIASGDIEDLSVLMHDCRDQPLEHVRVRQALYEAIGCSDIWMAMIDKDFEPE